MKQNVNRLNVYLGKQLIVVETNLDFAMRYWKERMRSNKKLRIEVVGV